MACYADEMSSPNTTQLRRAFVDICRGYSIGRTTNKRTIYVRHLGHVQHATFEDIQRDFEEEAKARGAQTEAESLAQLAAKGMWTAAQEAEIDKKRDFIGRLEEGRKTIAVPSVLRSHEDQIARERDGLAKTLTERARLLGTTVETHANRRLEDYYLVHNLFADRELTTPFLEEDVFDNLAESEVAVVHDAYKEAVEACSDANLRRLACQDFFMSYWMLTGDDAHAFFGRAVCELSYYQVRLSGLARYFKSLIENTDMNRLTLVKRNDPDAIEQLHITQKNSAAMQAKGETPVGMTSEDIKATGQQFSALPPPGLSGHELVKWIQKNQR